jgi:hypothetical protein
MQRIDLVGIILQSLNSATLVFQYPEQAGQENVEEAKKATAKCLQMLNIELDNMKVAFTGISKAPSDLIVR